jgi:hypothetical protein
MKEVQLELEEVLVSEPLAVDSSHGGHIQGVEEDD